MESNLNISVFLFLLALPPLVLLAFTRQRDSVILIRLSMVFLVIPFALGAVVSILRVIIMYDEDGILFMILLASPFLFFTSFSLSIAGFIKRSLNSKNLALTGILINLVYVALYWHFLTNFRYHA